MNDMLQRLEDKVISLVDELESLRAKLRTATRENQELQQLNQELRLQESTQQEKLQGLVSLLDSIEAEVSSESSVTSPAVREEVVA